MKTFQFVQKNSGVVIIISAINFQEAESILIDIVKDSWGFVINSEEGITE